MGTASQKAIEAARRVADFLTGAGHHKEANDVRRVCRSNDALRQTLAILYVDNIFLRHFGARIAEVLADEAGFWRPCSGCQESSESCVSTKDYPYSTMFRCKPGGGCRECGGLGVLWDTTDYDAMARYMLADDVAEKKPT